MQNTRLNQFINIVFFRLTAWLSNPWRKTSLVIISLLFGGFMATIISTIAGQKAVLDVVAALYLLIFTEVINRWVYGGNNQSLKKSFWLDILNSFKMGLVYNLFVEAFKLGS